MKLQGSKTAPSQPPRLATKLITWLVAEHLQEEVLGDLHERFLYREKRSGEQAARRRYWLEAMAYMRPAFIKKQKEEYGSAPLCSIYMIHSYFKVSVRGLIHNKGYAAINIGGLAIGMAVAMLVGLWVFDEISYNKSFEHYDQIAQVMQTQNFDGDIHTDAQVPAPLGEELQRNFGDDFISVVPSTVTEDHILAYENKKVTKKGKYIAAAAPQMLTMKMTSGSWAGLEQPGSILLSKSAASILFGEIDPLGKIVKIDGQIAVKVTGVYEDLPDNSSWNEVSFMAPWELYLSEVDKGRQTKDFWYNNYVQLFVQLADHTDINKVSAKIEKTLSKKLGPDYAKNDARIFLHPMSSWHLYSEWKNGLNIGGKIQYVRLFALIGSLVLLLACINFMNLATARSEKRAKEVGIRKAIGSLRSQLIGQFLMESLLMVGIAFYFCLLLVSLFLPLFNNAADKQLSILWSNSWFWILACGVILGTAIISGSYPAFYLSSFQPLKALKGSFRIGQFSSIPRKVLVVIQFTVSVSLIIGTIIIYRQIQVTKQRPLGYKGDGLIVIDMPTSDIHNHFGSFRSELLQTGFVLETSESTSPVTEMRQYEDGFSWKGKDPLLDVPFVTVGITHEFGKTLGWQIKEGRDFSRNFASDFSGVVLNEAAAEFMGLKNPVGETITWRHEPLTVLGVVKDVVMESPYEPVKRTVYYITSFPPRVVTVKIKPEFSAARAIVQIESIFRKYAPAIPFDFKFVDQEFDEKFRAEQRLLELSSLFTILATFISCLGLVGLASFISEKRTKEFGVRKVLGASIFNLWSLLSTDFLIPIFISCLIACPVAYYFLCGWLRQYTYHAEFYWWNFAIPITGVLILALLTTSFHSLKAALVNPVESLKTE